LGDKYAVHINLCLHRAPGYCILDIMDEAFTGIHVTREKTNIFTDIPTRDAFAHQWAYFAKRYKGIRSEKLSLNLVNEPLNLNGPAEITELTNAGKSADDAHTELAARFAQQYGEVARSAIDAIRKQDPDRLIVTDGFQARNEIIPGLFDSRVPQSCHTIPRCPSLITNASGPEARPLATRSRSRLGR
jgi:endoglucanase